MPNFYASKRGESFERFAERMTEELTQQKGVEFVLRSIFRSRFTDCKINFILLNTHFKRVTSLLKKSDQQNTINVSGGTY